LSFIVLFRPHQPVKVGSGCWGGAAYLLLSCHCAKHVLGVCSKVMMGCHLHLLLQPALAAVAVAANACWQVQTAWQKGMGTYLRPWRAWVCAWVRPAVSLCC
jgi:hypothetical protein